MKQMEQRAQKIGSNLVVESLRRYFSFPAYLEIGPHAFNSIPEGHRGDVRTMALDADENGTVALRLLVEKYGNKKKLDRYDVLVSRLEAEKTRIYSETVK